MMQGNAMMQMDCGHMLGGTGGTAMMIAWGVSWLLIVIVLLLSAAALIKYLRSGRELR